MPSGVFPYSSLVGSTVDTCLRQFTVAFVVDNSAMARFAGDDALRAVVGRLAARSGTVTSTLVACLDGLLVTLHLALCFFPCRQAQDALHHGRYGPEVQLCRCLDGLLVIRWCRNCPAVAVHRRSSTSLSCRRDSSPWSRLFGRPLSFFSSSSLSGGRCPCYAGRFPCPLLHDRRAWFRLCCTPWKCRSRESDSQVFCHPN